MKTSALVLLVMAGCVQGGGWQGESREQSVCQGVNPPDAGGLVIPDAGVPRLVQEVFRGPAGFRSVVPDSFYDRELAVLCSPAFFGMLSDGDPYMGEGEDWRCAPTRTLAVMPGGWSDPACTQVVAWVQEVSQVRGSFLAVPPGDGGRVGAFYPLLGVYTGRVWDRDQDGGCSEVPSVRRFYEVGPDVSARLVRMTRSFE